MDTQYDYSITYIYTGLKFRFGEKDLDIYVVKIFDIW